MFPSWCRRLVQSVLKDRSLRRNRWLTPLGSPGHFWRPRLEQLEDRIVPTTVSIPTNLTAVQGGIVTVPINVDTLSDPVHGTSGLSSGNFIVYYNPAVFSVSNADVNLGTIASPTAGDSTGTGVGDGYSPGALHGWSVVPQAYIPGYLNIGLGNSSAGIITNTGGGSLVTINFHIAGNAPLGSSAIDLAANTSGSAPFTYLNDQHAVKYALGPNAQGPQDNSTSNPYIYGGSDPDDGAITIVPAAIQLVVTGTPANITAGTPFLVTVTARNSLNNTVSTYSGAVQISSSDNQAVLPAAATLTAGVGMFSVTLKTSGSQTLTATPLVDSTFVQASGSPIAVGNATKNVAVGDFNGDEKPDLVVANSGTLNLDGSVSILPGNGDGTFQPAATIFSGAAVSPQGLAVGDFNGDDRLDLAVAIYDRIGQLPTLSILLGNGNGTFGAATNYVVGSGPAMPSSVAVGDFNGDGKLDVAMSWYSTGSSVKGDVAILLGNGNGTFGPVTNYPVGDFALGFAVGDFNHDGNADIAVANGASITLPNTVSVLLGNGDGTFAPATHYAVGQYPERVAVGDFNGDGNLDLAVTNAQSNTVSVLLGNGNGTFGPANNFAVGNGPVGIAVADLNLDGKLDLVATNSATNSVSVLLGNGDGTFASAQNYLVGTGAAGVVAADFNGDGASDLAVVGYPAPSAAGVTFVGSATILLYTHVTTGGAKVAVSAAEASQFTVTAPLVVTSFIPTSTGFVASFDKPFDATQLNLYDSASAALGPADVRLMGPSGAMRGSLLLDPTDTTITFVKTSTFTGSNFDPSTGLLAEGTYTATFRSASNGFKDLTGSLLDGNNSGVPGTNYVTTFVVNSAGVAVGIPSFARGPDGSQDINLPNTPSRPSPPRGEGRPVAFRLPSAMALE